MHVKQNHAWVPNSTSWFKTKHNFFFGSILKMEKVLQLVCILKFSLTEMLPYAYSILLHCFTFNFSQMAGFWIEGIAKQTIFDGLGESSCFFTYDSQIPLAKKKLKLCNDQTRKTRNYPTAELYVSNEMQQTLILPINIYSRLFLHILYRFNYSYYPFLVPL